MSRISQLGKGQREIDLLDEATDGEVQALVDDTEDWFRDACYTALECVRGGKPVAVGDFNEVLRGHAITILEKRDAWEGVR